MRQVAFLVLVLTAVLTGSAANGQPEPKAQEPSQTSLTDLQIHDLRTKHLAKVIAETYQKSKWRDPKWDVAMSRVQDATVEWILDGVDEVERTKLLATMKRLMDEGCARPLAD